MLGRTPRRTSPSMRPGLLAKGTSHVANSHIKTPKAYTSVAVDLSSPLNSSGAQYARVVSGAAACEPHNSVCPQALYIAFFDGESDRVKAENPKLKHSQVQQEVGPNVFTFAAAAASLTLIRAQVWQRWQRSPQNPKNQPRVAKGGDAGAEE